MMPDQNIFKLLSDDPAQYNAWSLKSKLMIIVSLEIKNQGLTQHEAAKKLKTTQPRVSNLQKGKMSKFSIDMLMEFIFRLGYSADITFNPRNLDQPIKLVMNKSLV